MPAGAAFAATVNVPQSQTPPYPPSSVLTNIDWDFANVYRTAPGSDLWTSTWAADGAIYTSWGDGGGFGGTNTDGRVSLGFGRITGSPPNMVGANVWGGQNPDNPATFKGKAFGIISVRGTLYSWINLQNGDPPDIKLAWSDNLGATWQKVTWKFPGVVGSFVPGNFIQFDKDYEGARDNFVYIYGIKWADATGSEAYASKEAYLARVNTAKIRSRTAYHYFTGLKASGAPMWSTNMSLAESVFTDINGVSATGAIYNAALGRYILSVAHGYPVGQVGQLGMFEAPQPWGPWATVVYYEDWGGYTGEALGYAMPTKWISPDGRTLWTIFSSSNLDSFNLVKGILTLGRGYFFMQSGSD